MKRFKTWKRYTRIYKAGDIGILCDTRTKLHPTAIDAIRSADLRKVMAVCNAAMKYHDLAKKDNDVATMLQYAEVERACERARK